MLNKKHKVNIAFASVALALIISFAPMISTMQNAQATNLSNSTQTTVSEMQAVQALTIKNLTPDEQNAGGTFFRIVWGTVETIAPQQTLALFADCNPGEFAVSGLKILGKDVQVLEDYPIALPDNSMSWLTVVYNGHSTDSLPVSIGVICADGNGLQSNNSNSGVSDETKNIVHKTINKLIQNGNINILQLINIQQTLIQQAIQIINVTGNNNTVNAIINQTANQVANLNVTNGDIINNIGNQSAQDNGVNPTTVTAPEVETPTATATATNTTGLTTENNEATETTTTTPVEEQPPVNNQLPDCPEGQVHDPTNNGECVDSTTTTTTDDTTTATEEEEQDNTNNANTEEEGDSSPVVEDDSSEEDNNSGDDSTETTTNDTPTETATTT